MEPKILIPFGQNAGLSLIDVVLLLLCPLCCALGTLVSVVLKRLNDPPNPMFMEPESGVPQEEMTETQRIENRDRLVRNQLAEQSFWNRRVEPRRLAFIGLALGFVISLYFVGAITNSITSLARVLALAILLGYQAPNIWFSQERVVKKIIDQKVKQALGEKTSESA